MRIWLHQLRWKHWAKNLLVLLPLLLSHHFVLDDFVRALVAAAAWCAVASGVYLLNDVYDRLEDARHPVKSQRPLAAGLLSLSAVSVSAAALIPVSLVFAWFMGPLFFTLVLAYLGLNLLYNFRLRQIPGVDLACLTIFYLLRILSGYQFIDERFSVWLLGFTGIFFFSLSCFKRAHDLVGGVMRNKLLKIGTSLWLLGTFHLLLYSLSPAAQALYGSPAFVSLCTAWHVFALWRIRIILGRKKRHEFIELILVDRYVLSISVLILTSFLLAL